MNESRIHLIGSEGFIGKTLQKEAKAFDIKCWSHQHKSKDKNFDLLEPYTWRALLDEKPQQVILLSWPDLSNYNSLNHIKKNLPACIELIEKMAENGLKRIVIAGTCYEYGTKNGCLRENQETSPVNCYSISKEGYINRGRLM